MDEPLSALDDETRTEMCDVLHAVRSHTGVTILHVSHNLNEARRLADLIYVLKDGALTLLPGDGESP